MDGSGFAPWFRWVKAPTNDELNQLTHTIAQQITRFLDRQGLLEGDAEHSTLALDTVNEDPMDQLLGHSISYHRCGSSARAQGVHLANLARL